MRVLRARGSRNGGARRAVIELLGRQQCCLTAQEIFDRLRTEGRRVGTASVYRALEQLTKDGFVQRVDLGAGSSRYEPIHSGGEHHHHHLVCDDCGRVDAFADEELERALHKVAGKTGYSLGHDVVLRGACEECARAF
jgi:Fur family transcriptional regulator, ferric uptake regulator